MKRRIELGDLVEDRITGTIGIVVAISEWIWGFRRVAVCLPQPNLGAKSVEFWLYEEHLKIVKKKAFKA